MYNKLEIFKKKLIYRAGYRGTKEMDILLTSFVDSIIDNLDFLELSQLNEFINCSDEEIYNFYFNNSFISFNNKKILSLFKNFKNK